MVTPKSNELKDAIIGFLSHGVAAEKWGEMHRAEKLKKFMTDYLNKGLQDIMINLASEMAKRCKED